MEVGDRRKNRKRERRFGGYKDEVVNLQHAVQAGEVAPRILLVGSTKRARLLAPLLRPPGSERDLFQVESSRGFLTITGPSLSFA